MRIKGQAEIDAGLEHLCKCDSAFGKMTKIAGNVPLRLGRPNFAGLASIIVSQQVSKASADAIFGRLCQMIEPLEAQDFLNAGDAVWKAAGLSRPKQRTLCAISEAVIDGSLDLGGLCELLPDNAMARMVAIKGIGPWTAEVYLLFCAGHADIFPAGDLALQEAIKIGYDLKERPNEKQSRLRAEAWSPWRGVAARLLWQYYRIVREGRDATPV